MQFRVKRRIQDFTKNYNEEELRIARIFAKKVYDEIGTLVQALILFGSSARTQVIKSRDIDVLILVDDVHIELTPEVVETYRIIIAKIIGDTDQERLHVQSMKLSTFWEYVRAGDPVAINILRDGVALIDTGFFDPLQALLDEGRIRPSKESIWNYYSLAAASQSRAEQHILTAIIDLYWAAIDAAHAALMILGEVPPTPSHVADVIEEKMVEPRIIEKKYANIMRELYLVSKKIIGREVRQYSGKDYDRFKVMADDFVNRMKIYIEKRK